MSNSHDIFLKTSWSEWIKLSAKITDVVGILEKEIERMKEKQLSDSLIDQKNDMVDAVIDFYNSTDQLISAYRIALVNKDAEIMIMRDALEHAIRTEWRERILTRLASDISQLKERKELTRELRDKMNG